MPYPAQTDRETIIQTAQTLIERDGVEQLSLAHLAGALGIKAPSLYRHVASKTALLAAVNTLTGQQLFQAFDRALSAAPNQPTERLKAIFRTQREFAHANPHCYILLFTTTETAERANEQLLEQLALPLQELIGHLSGPERALSALRGALALVHGFVMLELHGQFRRGGNLDAAFEAATRAYLAGWQGESLAG